MSNLALNITGKVIVNTGNILSIDDITKKPGQNPTEELIEAINATVKEYVNQNTNQTPQADHLLCVTRPSENVAEKISELGIGDLKIGLKIFVTPENHNFISEAIENVLAQLRIEYVHDVIISLRKKEPNENKEDLDQIKKVWEILEKYVGSNHIKQIGIADIEESAFKALHSWAKVKPSIIQINLAVCCVVPPTLQAFCKENDVRLLTHSDPSDILPQSSIQEIFGQDLDLQWLSRFSIHIKCRGVLTAKGYILSLTKSV